MAKKLYWRISGYDGSKTIFNRTFPLGQFNENQIRRLLQMLTAQAGLNFDEIVGACARRNSKLANALLDVQSSSRQATYTCGSNPHFVASVVDGAGKILVFPKH